MKRLLLTPKVQKFQESLAAMLRCNLVILDGDGRVLANYNGVNPPFSLFRENPGLEEDYRNFFRQLPAMDWDSRDIQALQDPLGLSAAAFSLKGELLILLTGYLDPKGDSREYVLSRLEDYGIVNCQDIMSSLPPFHWPGLQEQVLEIRALYGQLLMAGREEEKLGQNTVKLSVMEQVNKLMLSLLNLEYFDLQSFLNLIAGSLNILLDAEGAWVNAYHLSNKTTTAYRGAVWCELPVQVEEEWQKVFRERGYPKERFSTWENRLSFPRGEFKLEAVLLERDNFKIFLGAINPGAGDPAGLLDAISRRMAVVLEINGIYQVLQKRLRNLLNSLNNGLIVTNTQGVVMLANQVACDILGSQNSSLIPGSPLDQVGLPAEMTEAAAEAASRGMTCNNGESMLGEGGPALYLAWEAMPLLDDDNRIMGAILYFKDITQEINLRMQLQNSERLAVAGEVAASLVHEIRNPLTVAMGSIQFFNMIDDTKKQKKLIDMTLSELKRMNLILSNFLSLAKPNHDMGIGKMDPAKVLQEIGSLIRSEAMHNDIDLEIQQEAVPLVMGSKNGLKQVCLNLAKNAIEAVGRGGKLSVSLVMVNGEVQISFQDNGPGISQENLKNIFRPFFTTKAKGTGLGLCVSKKIIEDMGARLHFESMQGQGTTFHITFPQQILVPLEAGAGRNHGPPK